MSTARRVMPRWIVLALAGLVALTLSLVASVTLAHQVGISQGTYRLDEGTLSAELVLQSGELAAAAPAVDSDHDGRLSRAELEAAQGALVAVVFDGLVITGDGARCPRATGEAALVEGDGVALRASYVCPRTPRQALRVEAPFVAKLSSGHRHLAAIMAGARRVDGVLGVGHDAIELGLGDDAAPRGASFFSLLALGIEHILTGYDHLVFLLGLVVVGGRARSLALVVTAFTVAHSITLGLAALQIFAPPARLVEPLIALSIAYVGVENFFVKSAEGRWRVTFPFGLVHGFGFAGALSEIALPAAEIPKALLAFNLGVEVGQLGVLTALLPVLWLLSRARWFDRVGRKLVSALVVLLGLGWFVARVVS